MRKYGGDIPNIVWQAADIWYEPVTRYPGAVVTRYGGKSWIDRDIRQRPEAKSTFTSSGHTIHTIQCGQSSDTQISSHTGTCLVRKLISAQRGDLQKDRLIEMLRRRGVWLSLNPGFIPTSSVCWDKFKEAFLSPFIVHKSSSSKVSNEIGSQKTLDVTRLCLEDDWLRCWVQDKWDDSSDSYQHSLRVY